MSINMTVRLDGEISAKCELTRDHLYVWFHLGDACYGSLEVEQARKFGAELIAAADQCVEAQRRLDVVRGVVV